jgi:hypothetical protein
MSEWLDEIPWFVRRLEQQVMKEHIANVLSVKNQGWQYDEIIRLNVAVKRYESNPISWTQVAKFVQTRDSRSCRAKWDYLMKGSVKTAKRWDQKDDDELWHLRVVDGLTWKHIVTHFPGTTINTVLGRFKTLLKKRGSVQPVNRMVGVGPFTPSQMQPLFPISIHEGKHYSEPLKIPEPVKILEPTILEPVMPMLDPIDDFTPSWINDLHGDIPFIFDEEPHVNEFRDLMEDFEQWHPIYGDFTE